MKNLCRISKSITSLVVAYISNKYTIHTPREETHEKFIFYNNAKKVVINRSTYISQFI